jgi:bifunctional enzyme CysN/CysC
VYDTDVPRSDMLTPSTPGSERLSLVIGGHVDHGKSTIIGRLLADTGSLPEGKLDAVRASCARTGKPFEWAFLLDALKDEQAQGITIDSARVFFKTAARHCIIIDAPGHIEFLRNMITGAARADAALLVIDAKDGVQQNSLRHGYMMSLLGIRQLAVLVNKMDLVGFDRGEFERIEKEYRLFLGKIGVAPAGFIPVSGREGSNIARRDDRMGWYTGPTVLEQLDRFAPGAPEVDRAFRMPVQDVYRFPQEGDDRRIVAGSVDGGVLQVGDEVVFFPSGKRSRVKTIEAFNRPRPAMAQAGEATGFTLSEQIYVQRGELATRASEPAPHVTTRLQASLFWLGIRPFVPGKEYLLKLGTARAGARIEAIHRVIDAVTLEVTERSDKVDRHEVAECTLLLSRAIAFDLPEVGVTTSRFVIVDDYEICGGGIVRAALPDPQASARGRVLLRNYKWEPSNIPVERRAERYRQRPALVLITGVQGTDRKSLAKDLEHRLFESGRTVYFLGIGNVLYGVDADIGRTRENRQEHLRRLAEVANLMLDAGVILIVTAAELTQEDLDLIRVTVDPERIETIWLGPSGTTDIEFNLRIGDPDDPDAVGRIERLLLARGIIPGGGINGGDLA